MAALNTKPKFLQAFYKELEGMDDVGTDDSPPRYWFSMGNHCLNKVLSGSYQQGIPQGRIIGFVGPSGAGKSFLAGNVIKNAQSQGAFCLVVDSEGALDSQYMQLIGVNTEDNYQYLDVTSFAQVIKLVSSFISSYRDEYSKDLANAPKIVILIDSIANLMTESEVNIYKKGEMRADQGLHAKTAKAMLKSLVQDIKRLNVSVVVTGHARAATQDEIMLKGEGAWVCNEAFRFALSQILLVTKLRLKDKTSGDFTGITLKATGFKSRFTKIWQSAKIDVPYDEGINKYSGLLEAAEGLGVVKRAGSWYNIVGTDAKFQSKSIDEYGEQIVSLMESKSGDIHFDTAPTQVLMEDTK